ncbi:uncharacterized protein LOC144924165 [Branchiostoma floridae x Branchiostoma belcheri]
MQRSRHQTRERLSYSAEREEEIMRNCGLAYEEGPGGMPTVNLPEIIGCLVGEAGNLCNMGAYELALPWYEDALAVITHYPDVPLPCEFIYVLRARCCYEMGNFEKVIQDCIQVINFDTYGIIPSTWECYQMKVDAYIQLGNIYKALETACDFYIHCPWNLEAVAMIGDLRREIEDKEREAKRHGDELIRKEEQQSKKRKTVCQQRPLVKKNGKKKKEARTSGPGKRDASREAKKSSASSRESEASSHSTSDSEPQGLEEEDDSDQAAWAMVGKRPPIVTHNRFEITPPVVRSKQKSKAETRTKRKTVSPKPATNVPRADPPSRHVREFPPMMIRKPQSRMGFPKREQPSPSLRIQATTRPERHNMAGEETQGQTAL